MRRRSFCKTTLAAAVSATLPGCTSESQEAGADVGSLIPAVTSSGDEISIEAAAVAEFAESLHGRLYLQTDAGYDAARSVWNGMFDHKKPAMVIQCGTVDDVVSAVTFARERSLLVSVKCGGHSLPGKSTNDGGMMIDLSPMHVVDVSIEEKTARVDGGALLGHIDGASLKHYLLTTTGIVSHTGAGGFTLGGGLGRTDRKMGLAVDNLLAATVVTASGDVLQVSEDENPDLFWGLRGGGGNFGIATEFVYRLHPFEPTVYGGVLTYALSKDLLDFYAEHAGTLPDEANVEPSFFPGEDGAPVASIEFCWCGDHADGEKIFASFVNFPGRTGGELGPLSYHSMQTSADSFLGHGRQYYLKSSYLKELTPEAIDVILQYARAPGAPGSWFQHLGGASSRVAPDAMAYSHRDVGFNFGIMMITDDPAETEAGIAAVREYYAAMEPHMAGFYTNLDQDNEHKIWGNYGANYPRLVQLKNKYDPTNLFRLNANIKPTV
jgi:FAD/FMN-containing dehydrogenase